MPLKACVYRKKGMMHVLRRFARIWLSVLSAALCGTNTRVCQIQVSDQQRGTCTVEIPAKGGLCL